MSEDTMAALDAAIRAHYADVLADTPETHPIVGAWVLAVEIETLEDGEQCFGNDYTTGERTTPNAATGLAQWLIDELRGLHDEEEDDE